VKRTGPSVLIFLLLFFILNLILYPAPKRLIYLDASILPEGRLRSWKNLGVLGGEFVPVFRSQPTVEIIKNQKAVNLTAVDVLLRSTFAPPASLGGKQPFTLLVRVLVPELAQRRTILAWSQEPERAAIFGLGKGLDAAFFHSVRNKVGYQKGYPESGLWHLLAFVYDQKKLRVYVDGWLRAETDGPIQVKLDKYFYLGGLFASNLPLPLDPFNGYLASLELLDKAYSQVEIWNLAGRKEAIPLFPDEGETLQELKVTLKWERGDERTSSYALYFSVEKEGVERGQKKARRGSLPATSTMFEVSDLKPGQTYYWKVDELDSRGQVLSPGIVRSFKIDDGSARNPIPHHLHGSVRRDTSKVSWRPGPWAVSQDVYWATDLKKLEKAKPVVRGLKPELSSFFIPEKSLKPGQSYFWKVDIKNDSLPDSPGSVWSFRVEDTVDDSLITFFVAADLHYGGTVKTREINRSMVEIMNSLPGQKFPVELGAGGTILTPRGVVVLGDILDEGGTAEAEKFWQQYVEDFGLKGDRLLAFPVYEGFGEHDGPSSGLVRTNLRNRNRLRPGLRSISADGQHYSWDWGKVHFVMLNLYPGSVGEDYLSIWRRRLSGDARYPKQSLEFLKEDLRRQVGNSGRPVVIFQHYGFDSWSEAWWTQKERNAFLQAIQPYNVIAIFWGHSHVPQSLIWNGLRTWCAGSLNNDPEPGAFLVVQIKTGKRTGQMVVATRKGNTWLTAEKHSFSLRKVESKK